MADSTIAQSVARETLDIIALAVVKPEKPVPIVSVLFQSLEAAREWLPSELYNTVTTILDGCAQAERCN